MPNSRKLILIADDSAINRTFLRGSLGDDYDFIEVEDGVSALETLEERHSEISLLLLDIMMPRMNGYQVLESMQHNEALSAVPVIVVTSENDTASELRALENGASDFLTKPIESIVARRRVKTVLEQRELEELRMEQRLIDELRYRADHDDLTGIYSKEAFFRETQVIFENNPDQDYTLIRTNIEKFKLINELFGRPAGDEILIGLANLLKQKFTGIGTFGRLDSDNFVLCIPNDQIDLNEFSQAVQDVLRDSNVKQTVIISYGLVPVDDKSVPIDQLCDRAMLAMETVKGDYTCHYAYYDATMRQRLLDEQDILDAMEDALRNEEFEMYLQPVYDLATGRPGAAEALVRWNRPGVGMVSPGLFIPLFERNGFISDLDHYMWDKVCAMLEQRKNEGLNNIPISVNVSRKSLYNPHLYDDILEITERHHVDTDLFRIEVTESAYMDNAAQLIETVSNLQNHGFKILMDDFGSGYSSFNTLKDIPVDILKVDMKFMEGFEDGGRVGTILSSILRMSKWLGIPVVAEGVENVDQCEFLRGIGCDYIQGFYFARPMPFGEFEKHIEGLPAVLRNSSVELSDTDLSDVMGSNKFVEKVLGEAFDGFAIFEMTEGHLECIRGNLGYMDLYGFDETSFKASSLDVFSRVAPEDRKRANDQLQDCLATQKPQRTTLKISRVDNTLITVESTVECIRKTNDTSALFLIALRKLAEE